VAQTFAKYNFTAMPVVDSEDRLVGIVTVDDVIDVIQEEATEDISKMAAVTPADKPYLRLSVFELWRSRIPWLLILMISATFTGLIITHYENALATYVALTAFIPMLMDTGGNAGSQSTVTIIRSLSLGEISTKDTWKILWKEIRVAVLCGVTLAVVNFAKLMLFDKVGVQVSLVVCITLVFDVLAAKIVGALLPLGFAKGWPGSGSAGKPGADHDSGCPGAAYILCNSYKNSGNSITCYQGGARAPLLLLGITLQ
jgi:magnesium transporter